MKIDVQLFLFQMDSLFKVFLFQVLVSWFQELLLVMGVGAGLLFGEKKPFSTCCIDVFKKLRIFVE